MATHSLSSSRQDSKAPFPEAINRGVDADLTYDLRPYLQAAQEQLKSTLLAYREIFPDSLIWMGKFALSGQLKLFSLPEPLLGSLEEAIGPSVAPWPLYVLLSCKAALKPENR